MKNNSPQLGKFNSLKITKHLFLYAIILLLIVILNNWLFILFHVPYYFNYNFTMGDDYVNQLIIDKQNNVLINGQSCSLDFPTKYNENCGEPFISKLNSSTGKILWTFGPINKRILYYSYIIDMNDYYLIIGRIIQPGKTEWDPLNIFIMSVAYNGNFIKFKEFNIDMSISGAIVYPCNSLLILGSKFVKLDSNWNILWIDYLSIRYYFVDKSNAQIYFISLENYRYAIGKVSFNGSLEWKIWLNYLDNEYLTSIALLDNNILVNSQIINNNSTTLKTIYLSINGILENSTFQAYFQLSGIQDVFYVTNDSGYVLYQIYNYPSKVGSYFATFNKSFSFTNNFFVSNSNGNSQIMNDSNGNLFFSINTMDNSFNKYVHDDNSFYKGGFDILTLKICPSTNHILWVSYLGGKDYDVSFGVVDMNNLFIYYSFMFVIVEIYVYNKKGTKIISKKIIGI